MVRYVREAGRRGGLARRTWMACISGSRAEVFGAQTLQCAGLREVGGLDRARETMDACRGALGKRLSPQGGPRALAERRRAWRTDAPSPSRGHP